MHMSSISANWAGKDAKSLLWLASYPRSGNTFTRLLLANYFFPGEEAFDINKLADFIPADTSGLLWDHLSSILPNSIETTWRNRASVFNRYRETGKSAGFFGLKTHTANVEVFGSQGFDFRPNDRILYIVRHPLDVLLSYSDYNGRQRDSAIEVMCTSGATVENKQLGGLEVRGSWVEHVRSWLTPPPCPLFLVRYEELCLATEVTLRNILAFLGAPIFPEKIKHAVEATRFDRIRDQEMARNFKERPETTLSGAFFRKGTALQWLRELTPAQAYRLADSCGDVMEQLGYTHPRDVLFDGRNALQPVKLPA